MERLGMRRNEMTDGSENRLKTVVRRANRGATEVEMTTFRMGRRLVFGFLLSLAACLPSIGCQGTLVTAYYLIHGLDVDPDFPGLKDKKVAVVCRPIGSIHYSNSNVTREISQHVSDLLQEKVKKIRVVDQRKVAKWVDENRWDEFSEVGKAMKADFVVGIDLEAFSLFEGQTLYQGRANLAVHVYDCEKKKEVFTRNLPQAVYPPNTGVPTYDKQEAQFRAEFVKVLADRVARHFYAHDPHADVALDAEAFRR